jgi:hypothetical protein
LDLSSRQQRSRRVNRRVLARSGYQHAVMAKLWPRPRADVLRAEGAGAASEAWRSVNLLISHDHEGFSTLYSIKCFMIMKISLLGSD